MKTDLSELVYWMSQIARDIIETFINILGVALLVSGIWLIIVANRMPTAGNVPDSEQVRNFGSIAGYVYGVILIICGIVLIIHGIRYWLSHPHTLIARKKMDKHI
jgi:uncharacterized membrane protein HdeD (DUF308 family)